MAQILVPISDQATGSWTTTPLWSKVDDDSTVSPTGDGTTITSDNNTSPDNADLELTNTGISDPGVSTGHIIRARWNKSASGGHAINAVCELWQGIPGTGTLIATLSVTNIGATEVGSTYTLSAGEANSISDYNDLYLRVSRQGDTGGPPGNRRSLVVDLVEFEIPDANTDRQAQVSWAEMEVPNAPRQAQLSWAEMEAPTPPRQAQVSWAEMEIPTAPRRAQLSWAEMEVPTAPRQAQLSWAEIEIPGIERHAQVSWAEFEVPTAPRQGQVSWAELEIPTATRQAQLSWAEMEIPLAPRHGQVSWAEFEIPTAPRQAQFSWAEAEIPTAPRQAQLSWAEFEIPDVPINDKQAQIAWAEFQVPSAPGTGDSHRYSTEIARPGRELRTGG